MGQNNYYKGALVEELRLAGRGAVRRRLEHMVNTDVIGVAGAQRLYHEAFGGTLKAVKVKKPSLLSRVFGTPNREGGAR